MQPNVKYRIAVRGLIEKDGKYLLLQRSKPSRGEMGYWELPGGGQDFGESPQEALLREIMEETQLEAEVHNPISVWHYVRDNRVQIIGMTFACKALGTDVVLSDEHVAYKWLTIEQIKTMKIFPELLDELGKMDV